MLLMKGSITALSNVPFRLCAALALFMLGCDRELPIVEDHREVEGYQIEGYVRDKLGSPLAYIDVKVDYEFELLNTSESPSRSFVVAAPGMFVSVVVLDGKGSNIRLITAGSYSAGTIEVLWDKRMSDGREAPSGVYWVHYMVDGVSRKSYPVVVTNVISARTDSLGFYVISRDNLPIGLSPVPLFSSGYSGFLGNHRIGARVFLDFISASRIRTLTVRPWKNRVTRLDIIFY